MPKVATKKLGMKIEMISMDGCRREVAHFELYCDAKKEYRWRLVASNGNTIADSGEGYKRKAECTAMIHRIVEMEHAVVIDKEKP